MRILRWIVPTLVAVAALLLVPGWAFASTVSTDQVNGLEYSATSTVGKFAGTATGDLPGAFTATVAHAPLDPRPGMSVPITGGSFTLYSRRIITGSFSGGAVTLLASPSNCRDETYEVTGTLNGLNTGGSGDVTVILTHLRRQLGAQCLTYGARVAGSLNIALPGPDGPGSP
ncbi:hypothetical protein GCM10009609_37440 [Pseudonocardia aurantiaca]|uniref:CHRD domain-containing protein n=1 Tax=Pseudonocardia aurantiaca TaxID=75290 RepID=A0ABW4FNU6_9PSEU